MTKKYFIETFGCQMNKNDSELIALSLEEEGYMKSSDIDHADIVIYNTCSVREHAEKRVISRIRSAKKSIHSRNGKIIVAGCMAQRIGEGLDRDKIADVIIGPYQSPEMGKILKDYFNNENNNLFISQDEKDFNIRFKNRSLLDKDQFNWHKFVTITHGCENFCTYCIVPNVRGKLISFSSKEILNHIKTIAAEGITEITLLGQNVNQYGEDNNEIPFYKLLEKISEIEGIIKVNFLTSHPKDFSSNIIDVIQSHDNISRGIHLPLQSGSDRILKKMNRDYTLEKYMGIINYIKNKLDDFSITTDLIVGFPGESEKDFKDTLNCVKEIEFDEAFTFAYSPREGTPAFKLKEELSKKEKLDRLNELIIIQREISRNKLQKRIGNDEIVVPERFSKKSDKEIYGKTFLNHPVVFEGTSDDIGIFKTIKITGLNGSTLIGKMI